MNLRDIFIAMNYKGKSNNSSSNNNNNSGLYGTTPVTIEFFNGEDEVSNLSYIVYILAGDHFLFYPGAFGDGGDCKINTGGLITTVSGVDLGIVYDTDWDYVDIIEYNDTVINAEDLETVVINDGGFPVTVKRFTVPDVSNESFITVQMKSSYL